ncbi:cyclic nucleotide-binding domain-containing protein [Simiduia aestuariiviva]|uniref:Signal-transduction protein with cAMP-binding, CBS, and nucleotidyltransferase domain n=1 Tax=Simiduia aestuariiviva TaxID=1510459 RepID=A0A839UM85_9GAMM|nr:cyclic nucleotide-binding domain-containing protein [Simiduia aestuariiviva]MBB3169304.1 signal-transduction protein with cAMP-binding, CBS, and nucleotidyltransferase domain [Simiduia aestuariiviva]
MHLTETQPEHLSELTLKLRGLTELLLHTVPTGEPIFFEQSADVFAELPNNQLLLLTEGDVHLERQGKLLMEYEAGDLLGLSRALQLPEGKLVATQARFLPLSRDDLIVRVNASSELQKHWAHYLICVATFFREAFALEKRAAFQPSTGFMSFSAGETIIAQGETANCVYTLLEGQAEAIRDGVKVGDIHADEIFGALAVFTRQPRNATVIAKTDCSVMAVRKEDFIDLVEHQPQICISLIEEMAEKINQLNQQVAAGN